MVTKSDRVKISLDPEKKRKEALRKREQKKRKKLGKAPSVARPAQQVTITRDPQIAAARKRKEVLRKRDQRTRKQGTRGTLQGGAHE